MGTAVNIISPLAMWVVLFVAYRKQKARPARPGDSWAKRHPLLAVIICMYVAVGIVLLIVTLSGAVHRNTGARVTLDVLAGLALLAAWYRTRKPRP